MRENSDYVFKLKVELYFNRLDGDLEEWERVEREDRIRPELMPGPPIEEGYEDRRTRHVDPIRMTI